MICSKCGAENSEGARFCSQCGAKLGAAETPAPTEVTAKPEPESSTGIPASAAGFLCYAAGWITGIVFVLLEKKSTFVKFHAWQSIITFLVLTVIQVTLLLIAAILPDASVLWRIASVFSAIVWFITVGLWVALMFLAYQGNMWKVPAIGDWAEEQANK